MTDLPGRVERHVVIIGAGISGLVVAWRLLEHVRAGSRASSEGKNRPEERPVRITLLDAGERPGGKLVTEHVDGFTIDHGPDVFLARKPWAVDLCHDLGLGNRLRPTNQKLAGSFIKHQGRLIALPSGLSGLVPTRIGPILRTPLLSAAGKARLAVELFVPRRRVDGDESGDEALGAFIRRRFGREMHERLIGPLLGGIYGGDVDALSLRATFPQFETLEREYGSLIRAMLARRRDQSTGAPAFMTLEGGMGLLPDTLARRLTASDQASDGCAASVEHILSGVAACRIRPEPAGKGFSVECDGGRRFAADAVVCTTPAYTAADLLEADRPDLSAILNEIPYNSSLIATFAFAREELSHPLDGYGYLIPEAENDPVRACTFSSSKIPGRAPDDGVLMRLFFGRSPEDPMLTADDETVYRTAELELEQTLGITAEPLFRRIRRWPKAQPAYTLGHPERLDRIDQGLEGTPGLFLTGSAYRGVGIPDCINQAELTATDVAAYLR